MGWTARCFINKNSELFFMLKEWLHAISKCCTAVKEIALLTFKTMWHQI